MSDLIAVVLATDPLNLAIGLIFGMVVLLIIEAIYDIRKHGNPTPVFMFLVYGIVWLVIIMVIGEITKI